MHEHLLESVRKHSHTDTHTHMHSGNSDYMYQRQINYLHYLDHIEHRTHHISGAPGYNAMFDSDK